jgi:hypothetical protein
MYVHLGCPEEQTTDAENAFRKIQIFDDRKIVDFHAHNAYSSVVILEGDSAAYSHTLPDKSVVKGLLHFYKGKDNLWKFLSEDQYQDKKDELPGLSFAIKCPIKDIPSLEWPDLEALEKEIVDQEAPKADKLVHKQFSSIEGPLYYSKCIINNEEIEITQSASTIFSETKHDLNPIIYLRINKPLKQDCVMPSISLEKYYKQGESHGIALEIIPDLTTQKNSELIRLTQSKWDEIGENIAKCDPKHKREFLWAVDQIAKSFNIDATDFDKEFKVGDLQLDDNKALKKLSDKCKKQWSNLYWMLNQNFFSALVYSTRGQRGVDGSIYELLNAMKSTLLPSAKSKYVDTMIQKLPTGSQGSVKIKRH